MQAPTKIRLRAVFIILFWIAVSPLAFLAAGMHEQFLAEDRVRPRGTFWYGLKTMNLAYIEVISEAWNEVKFGEVLLENKCHTQQTK